MILQVLLYVASPLSGVLVIVAMESSNRLSQAIGKQVQHTTAKASFSHAAKHAETAGHVGSPDWLYWN